MNKGRSICVLLLGIAALLGVGLSGSAARAEQPQRIVSLTVCTDQLLLDLVSRDRIAALSYLAVDPTLSGKVEEARGIKGVRGMAEEVLELEPDLVIAQEHSTTAAVNLLRRLGFRLVLVPLAADFEEMRRAIRIIAAAVGSEARGEQLIASFDARLAAATSEGSNRPRAVAYQVNSLTSGPGTLVDSALESAGFYNLAREWAVGPGGRLPLESIVADPPDLIVLANAPDDFRSVVGDNLRHPAFAKLLDRVPHFRLAMPLWLCATPEIAEAVEQLSGMRRSLRKDE